MRTHSDFSPVLKTSGTQTKNSIILKLYPQGDGKWEVLWDQCQTLKTPAVHSFRGTIETL